jgi:hypothetical protein
MESAENEAALRSAWTNFMAEDFPRLTAQLAALAN